MSHASLRASSHRLRARAVRRAVWASARAQQPVVFIHGVASGPDTWQETADRLQNRLQITAQRAEVSWWNSLEHQSGEMQNRFGGLPNSTIAVGHSLGGLVAREWSRAHELDGIITIGAPNRGAPIANHINEWAGFNASLFNAVGTAFYRLERPVVRPVVVGVVGGARGR